MTQADMEAAAARALDAVPERFRARMRNLAIVVETAEEAWRRNPEADPDPRELFGLHEGPSITEMPADPTGSLPSKITLFRDVILEEVDGDATEAALIVRETLWHEIAHHFGYDEDGAERLERQWEERYRERYPDHF